MQSTIMPPYKAIAVCEGDVELNDGSSVSVSVVRLDEDRLAIDLSVFMGNMGRYVLIDGETATTIANMIVKAVKEMASYQ